VRACARVCVCVHVCERACVCTAAGPSPCEGSRTGQVRAHRTHSCLVVRSRLPARSRRSRLCGTHSGTHSGTHRGTHRGTHGGTRPAFSIGTSGANSSMRLGGTGPTSGAVGRLSRRIGSHLSSLRHRNRERTRQRTRSRETDRQIAHFRIPIPGQSVSGIGSPVSPFFGAGFPIFDFRLRIGRDPERETGRLPIRPGPGIEFPGAACRGFPGLVGTREFGSRAKTRQAFCWLHCRMPHHPATPQAKLGSRIRLRGPSSFSPVIPPNQQEADSGVDAPAMAWLWAPR
jgi:hypothetical protein